MVALALQELPELQQKNNEPGLLQKLDTVKPFIYEL
jgi:hypothetical protein